MIRAMLVLAALAASAHAFPTGTQFELDALTSDGGGGIAFDGAPRFVGHTCAVCHTGAPGQIETRLESDHPEMFTDGWKPGAQYHMRVVLSGAHEGQQYQPDGDNCGFLVMPYRPCDQNGFALEIDDAGGGPKGTFAAVVNNACATGMPPPDIDIRIFADGTAITHNGARHGQLSWDFCWTAPAAGAGTLTAYVAVVDGNGGDGTMAFTADTTGDDVTAGAVPIVELGGKQMNQSGGCSAGRDGGIGLVLVVLALLLRRRKAFAITLALASGCVHVRPHQREALARRNMKFAPDPTEDELDLHMQEAREGSSGGYGSSGGGCGCN